MAEEELDNLTSASPIVMATSVENTRTCPICQESETLTNVNHEVNENARILPCGHYVHKACFSRWSRVNNTCPLCRAIVNPLFPAISPAGVEINLEEETMASQLMEIRESVIRRAVYRLQRVLTEEELSLTIDGISKLRKSRQRDSSNVVRRPRVTKEKILKKTVIGALLTKVGYSANFMDNVGIDFENSVNSKILISFLNGMIIENLDLIPGCKITQTPSNE